jgi:hypothetical protein
MSITNCFLLHIHLNILYLEMTLCFISLLSLYWKNESRPMRSPCCLWIPPILLIFECLKQSYETWYACHGTCAHLNGVLHKSLPSICMCITPTVARQRRDKHVPATTNKYNNSRIVVCMCLRVCLSIPLSLLRNNSVKTFPWQRRIVGVVFCAVRVLSKESRQLVLPRTFCFKCILLIVL